jgi:hypothetical protein
VTQAPVTAVTSERLPGVRVVSVTGDVTSAATLVALHQELSLLTFTEEVPVVVDLSAATGTSPAVVRLCDRVRRVMASRGLVLTVHDGAPANA